MEPTTRPLTASFGLEILDVDLSNLDAGSFQRDFADENRIKTSHERTPPARHPMVLQHPVSGERSLYLDPNKTFAVDGVAQAATKAFLDEVFSHVLRDEFIYIHTWRNGDVVMWDNAPLMHRREAYDETLPRLARRAAIFLREAEFAVPEPGQQQAAASR